MYLLQNLFALALAAWLVWLPGWWLERRWLEMPEERGLRFLTRFACGMALWAGTLFALASAGLYRVAPLLALVLFWHLAASLELRRRGLRIFADLGVKRFSRSTLLLVLTALSVLIPILALALTPIISRDAGVYHLTLPKLYLEYGGFHLIPMNVYSHWPHGIELLFGVAMVFHSQVLAKLLHFGCGLLVLIGLFRLVPGRAGWLAAAFFALNGVVLFEMRVAYVDLAHAFALLAGVTLAFHAAKARGRDAIRLSVASGLVAGLLVSIKVTGVVSAFCLALVLVPRWRRELSLNGLARTIRSIVAFVLPATILGAPWWIKTWIFTGNPFYPWMWNLFGGPDWSQELGHQLATWQGGIGMGRDWSDYLLLPWRVIVEGGQGYGRFDGEIGLFWLVVLPLSLLATRSKVELSALWRCFLLVAFLHAAFWAATSQQMRFLIPVMALLAAPAAASLAEFGHSWLIERPVRRRLILIASTSFFLAWSLLQHGRVLISGARLMPALLQATVSPPAAREPIFEDIARLPEHALVLFLNTNQGLYSERPYLADSFFEASQINAWLRDISTPEQARKRLRERNVTHILYLHSPEGGLPYPQPLFDLLNDPRAVDRLAFDGRYLLLALR